jgi:hypothetical protein
MPIDRTADTVVSLINRLELEPDPDLTHVATRRVMKEVRAA